jgi:hypothetical protein
MNKRIIKIDVGEMSSWQAEDYIRWVEDRRKKNLPIDEIFMPPTQTRWQKVKRWIKEFVDSLGYI